MDAKSDAPPAAAGLEGRAAQCRAFAAALGDVARLWRGQIDRCVRPLGLSFMQWLTLSLLSRLDEDIVQKDLASALGIEGPTMVGVLDRLVDAGLVERRVSPQDRRANTVHVTPQGKALFARSEKALARLREALLDGLPEGDVLAGIRVLEHVAGRARAL